MMMINCHISSSKGTNGEAAVIIKVVWSNSVLLVH